MGVLFLCRGAVGVFYCPSWWAREETFFTVIYFIIFIKMPNSFFFFLKTRDSCYRRKSFWLKLRGSLNKCPDFFFVWALLLIVRTWNSSPLRSNLLRLQCTCCTVPTSSGRPHGNPLVWACQWPSSQPLSSPQLSHNDSLWAWGINKSHREQGLDYWEGKQVVDWCIVLVEMPLTRFEECWPLPKESLPELP